MSVHYKFKSTLDYDTITFDGLHISVADLKKAILVQKRLSKITDFDLQIINAQTKEEYQHESSLIPKNTSLIISRVPVANQAKKSWDPSSRPVQPRIPPKVESADFDLSKMDGSEEDKIQAMMLQSTAEYDPKSYQKIRGYSQTGEVPATYRCNKCKKGGHWIKNCPYIISKEHTVEKRTTGIPKSFRDKDDRAIMIDNQESAVEEEKGEEIPEDLICSICNDLFVDAVMIPCCGSSFCDDCVRTALLESEDNECPDCKEKGSSPGSLIPNRFLRNSVNAFKNRTGYKAGSQTKKVSLELNIQSQDEVESKQSEKLIEKETNDDVKEEETTTVCETECQENEEIEDKPISTSAQPLEESKEVLKDEKSVNSPAHEDSDYEDNIVVTVPSASDTRTEKYLTRRHGSHPKPPGIEQSSPKSKQQENNSYKPSDHSSHSAKEWEHSSQEKVHEHLENANTDHFLYEKNRSLSSSKSVDNVQPPGANPIPVPVYPHQSYDMQQQRPIRPINMHPGYHNHMHRPPLYPHPNMPPHHPPHQMRLPMPPINTYDPAYNPIGNVAPGYQRFPSSMPNRFNYPIRELENSNHMRPFNNIASVYEEVAAKVGIGIIDDPLEAFNRIMKEKEKKKDERRSPDRRRRSKDRHVRGNFRTSPYNNRTKDHGYYDKRGRSRERDNDRRWPRYMKGIDKERERERDSFRERDREREKDQAYRTRRSKSLDRNSRSRSHSPPLNKRYRSPQAAKPHNTHEKNQHHYHPNKFRNDEQQEDAYDRQKRDTGRSLGSTSKSLDSRGGNRQQIDHEDKNMEIRRPYNINDENLEPPPPGFEIQSRNPFHTNNTSSLPGTIRERDRSLRNNTPDLYEKCVSQDMEENKFYNISSSKADQKSKSKSPTRSRSRSPSAARVNEKRRKIHRSTTPKGKPNDGHQKREKDTTLSNRSHSHIKHKTEEHHSRKEKDLNDHNESKRKSMTPPRHKDMISDQHQTSSETDHKEKSESKKSDKKLKDRKKKRREKTERKKVKKEKKSKKERHRVKSEEKDNPNKDDEKEELNVTANSVESNHENKSEMVFEDQKEILEDELHSIEQDLGYNSTPKKEQNGLFTAQSEGTPKKQHSIAENEEKTPTSSDIKCFDAVLDIHEYETDFDDNTFKLQDSTAKLVPEASKWELDDQTGGVATQLAADKLDAGQTHDLTENKVTNDVIVRAEKAIFARAINAIRPIEVRTKSESKEKSSKCFGDEHESIRNIQITLPVNINKDRSIEVKTESNEKKKSIKDRLGSKVVNQTIYSQVADSRRDSDQTYKPSFSNTDRNFENERNRDHRKKSITDNKDNNSKRSGEGDKNYRERQGRDRERSHEREKDRDRARGRDKERVRHREKDVDGKDRDHDSDKNRERIRDRHGHEHDTDRSRRHSKDHKTAKLDKSHQSIEREHRDFENSSRKRHQSNSPSVVQKKRSISSTNSESDDDDRKRKLSKSDKKSRRRTETPESENGKKSNKKKNKSDKKKKKKSKK